MADQPLPVGMLPALEDPEYFSGLHTVLISDIFYWLSQKLPDRYKVSVERGLSMSNLLGKDPHFRPDVRVDERKTSAWEAVAGSAYKEPTYVLELPDTTQRLLTLRDDARNLVTTIEILSPANKSSAGVRTFEAKQRTLANQGVNLVEIDLLRTGYRRSPFDEIPQSEYIIGVLNSVLEVAEAWTASPGQALPTFPVPLREPDQPVGLPLEEIMQEFLRKSGLGRRLS